MFIYVASQYQDLHFLDGPRMALQIQSIDRDADGVVTVYVQNVRDDTQVLSSVYVDDILNDPVTPLPLALNETETAKIVLSGNYSDLTQVNVKVVTTESTFMELTKTFPD